MSLLVMKFGGTSVANVDRIKRAAKRVALEVAHGKNVLVIVSAMSGKTNELVDWVNDTSQFYDASEYDAVVSSGENVTAGLMALTLQEMDIPARSWQGWQVPVRTTSGHSSARIESISPKIINEKFLVSIKNLNSIKRPISAVADNIEVRNAKNIVVKTDQKIKFNLLEIGKIFGILQENPDTWLGYGKSKNIDQDTIERLIKNRNEARRNKNFDMADEIRKRLKEEGVEIEDTSDGTIWRSI